MMNMQTAVYTNGNGSAASARKLFYRINEVAKMTGLKAYVLRYWETEFPELRPEKDASDQRRYRQKDIEVILAIRKLLYEERYTIKGARQRLKVELRREAETNGEKANGGAVSESPTMRSPRKVIAKAKVEEQAPPPAAKAQAVQEKVTAVRFGKPRAMTLGETLFHLRKEVNELIKILDA
jgi:DNA-binding transcriptional MerR regulator